MSNMNITNSLNYLASHPWLKKSFAKLGKQDIEFIINFYNKDFKNKDEAMLACNRAFMDCAEKPKNWKIILEMLSCITTHHFQAP